ncbi:leishmanolysin-like peptidase isoform X2 [Ptychodera flava]|uniref:leishmanolysin-like peptidase isoform X2 n=1 Tax=Ptychodera flava TaxID=63121 RepID=UPI003969EC14
MAIETGGVAGRRSRFCALLFLFLPIHTFSAVHKCNHQHPGLDEVRHTYLDAHHSIRKRSADQNIRIFVWYENSVNSLDTEKRNLIKVSLIPEALNYFSTTFQVRPTGAPIRLTRSCATKDYQVLPNDPNQYCLGACAAQTKCGYVTVPEEHLQACHICNYDNGVQCGPGSPGEGPGVEGYDFILYVTAMQTERCGWDDTIGFATWCQLETALDRPVAGFANLCPNSLSTESANYNNILGSLKHEILHALGFSASLYAFYRDKNGDPLTERMADGKPPRNYAINMHQWSDRVVQTIRRSDWTVRQGTVPHDVQMLVTPRVVEEARNHFNCPTLEGVEIENQGGSGSELSHFEKRLFENEVMTGVHSQTRIFSRLALAVMEDTGWYSVNYDNAEPLIWGQNLGCDFAKKSCKYWIDLQKARQEEVDPYCDTVGSVEFRLQCNTDRSSLALCNIHKYDIDLPVEYQYFNKLDGISDHELGKYGGSVEMADFCPFHQELEWESDTAPTRTSHCNNPANAPDSAHSYSLEHYGENSVCIEQGSAWRKQKCNQVVTQHQWGSGCYKYSCSNTYGLVIEVNRQEYICYEEGLVLSVSDIVDDWLHEGTLICPSCQEVCGAEISCPSDRDPLPNNRTTEPQAIPCVSGSPMITQSFTLPVLLITGWLHTSSRHFDNLQ